ncbi:Dihydrolipoyllysine-residue acetyltransferase component 4 of pyruvate dehydrogenase complex chloroplastic, partial [Bienertia sinuspersici]
MKRTGREGSCQTTTTSRLCWTEPAPSVIPEEVVDCSTPVYGGRKDIVTPYAKKLAKQHKVELRSVTGTGLFGRITPEDVEKAAGIVKPNAVEVVPDSAPMLVISSSIHSNAGSYCKQYDGELSAPTFRVGYHVLTDALDALYDKVKKGVTMTSLLDKATAMALVQHPMLKPTCKDSINGGLITPILQDADKLDLYLLLKKLIELVEKARAKQLQPQESCVGCAFVGTFTLSILGMFRVDRFDVILPLGQGAIMAVGASKPTVLADASGYFSVKNKML